MTLDELNTAAGAHAVETFVGCCGARAWAQAMTDRRPFADVRDVLQSADEVWSSLERDDVQEAFAAHPRIGERTADRLAGSEQSGMRDATDDVRERMARGNEAYFDRFGWIFLICATGKTAAEMLAALETRLHHDADIEFDIAREQQRLITRLRIEGLLST